MTQWRKLFRRIDAVWVKRPLDSLCLLALGLDRQRPGSHFASGAGLGEGVSSPHPGLDRFPA